MNESPIVLACEDVTLGYEHKPLLEHLTLTVRAGDYLCIVGERQRQGQAPRRRPPGQDPQLEEGLCAAR